VLYATQPPIETEDGGRFLMRFRLPAEEGGLAAEGAEVGEVEFIGEEGASREPDATDVRLALEKEKEREATKRKRKRQQASSDAAAAAGAAAAGRAAGGEFEGEEGAGEEGGDWEEEEEDAKCEGCGSAEAGNGGMRYTRIFAVLWMS